MSTVPTSPLDQAKQAIRATPSPTRQRARLHRWMLLAASLLVLLGTVFMRGPLIPRQKPWEYTAVLSLGMAALATVLGAVLRRFNTSMLGPPRELLQLANRVAIPGLLVAALIANFASPETLHWPSSQAMCHLPCAMLLMVSAGLLSWCGIVALRRADPVTPHITGAAVGAVAGAWASLAVSLQCALSDPIHTMGTHVLPVGIIMLVAGRVGSRWIGLKK